MMYSMSSEVFGRWIILAAKIYAVYFVAMFVGFGIILMVYTLVKVWRERKGGDKDDREGSL